jgi:hypothetical protein
MDLSGNPYVIYPGDAVEDGYVEIRSNPIFISTIQWANYTDANHVCDLKDSDDREVFFRLGNSDLSPVELQVSAGAIQGLRLYALGSGQLYIYVR